LELFTTDNRRDILADALDVVAAAQSGDVEKLREILRGCGPSLATAKDASGVSALMHAFYRRQQAAADLLLAAKSDLDIFEATAAGKYEKVSEILERDPNAAKSWSADGFTALHFAAFFNRHEIARALIRHGAGVSAVAKNPMKVMPLHSAAAAHSGEIVRVLLENGAPPNVPQEGGWLPLHEAAQIGDKEMVKVLLEYGADPQLRSNDGRTAADMAKAKGHEDIVKLLS
jgi:ankyrin repeat protein